MYYYAQNINANESFPIIGNDYKAITDYNTAIEVFLANFNQETYILVSSN